MLFRSSTNTIKYDQTVLKPVNLGGDTDTTACVTGALAGLYYGAKEIPSNWQSSIARVEDIRSLATKFAAAIPQHSTLNASPYPWPSSPVN